MKGAPTMSDIKVTILIENGASPMAVSRILGHSTLAMTNRYVHISTTTKQEILNAIPQIF